VFVYPYAKTREALQGIARASIDPHHGFKLRFVNPATGRSPMPTIGTFAQHLPAGFATRPSRSSDSTVHVCLEGGGTATIGGQAHRFSRRDIFVVPSWHAVSHRTSEDAVLFSFSDRPAQKALGIWREDAR
jgi:gentisate 1,2-dioxygenase